MMILSLPATFSSSVSDRLPIRRRLSLRWPSHALEFLDFSLCGGSLCGGITGFGPKAIGLPRNPSGHAQSSLALRFAETIFEDMGYNLRYKLGYIDSVKSKN